MKRILQSIVCASLLAAGTGTLAARENKADKTREKIYTVQTNKFWNNWFISLGAGAQTYFGDNDSRGCFGDRIAPALQLSAGKWFTPGLGLRGSLSGIQAKGFTTAGNMFATRSMTRDGIYRQKWNMTFLHADALFNLSNMLCGYNENRVYSFIPYVGFGWACTWKSDRHNNEFGATAGLINRFRVAKAWDLNLEISGLILKDGFDGEIGGTAADGLLAVTVGATYKFKHRGFKKSASCQISGSEMQRIQDQLREQQEKAEALKAQNCALQDQNKGLQDEVTALQASKTQEAATCKAADAFNPRTVFFRINRSTLSAEEKETLRYAAEAMKADPNQRFIVKGFADKGTGTVQFNQQLSEKRAQAVCDILVNEFGVNRDQLQAKGEGGVDNLFADQKMNRAVMIQSM